MSEKRTLFGRLSTVVVAAIPEKSDPGSLISLSLSLCTQKQRGMKEKRGNRQKEKGATMGEKKKKKKKKGRRRKRAKIFIPQKFPPPPPFMLPLLWQMVVCGGGGKGRRFDWPKKEEEQEQEEWKKLLWGGGERGVSPARGRVLFLPFLAAGG